MEFNRLIKEIPVQSSINWKVGTPPKGGLYIVLFLDCRNKLSVNTDVWFEVSKRWQSQFHNLIAWCYLEDIVHLYDI